jgi:hypothetical protein
MKKVYLISCQDAWCPENNQGDWILEVWQNEMEAEERCKVLDKKSKGMYNHYTIEHELHGSEELQAWDEKRVSGAV